MTKPSVTSSSWAGGAISHFNYVYDKINYDFIIIRQFDIPYRGTQVGLSNAVLHHHKGNENEMEYQRLVSEFLPEEAPFPESEMRKVQRSAAPLRR